MLSMVKGTALFDAVAISETEAFNVRYWQFGAASRGRCAVRRVWADGVRGRFAAGVAAPAVRRTAMAAWCAWTMGPSRSRAERSRVPWRCVRALRSHVACRKCSYFALHVAHDAACHAVWVWAATCCNMLYVARCVMWHAGVVHCAVQPLCGAGRRNGCCALYALCCRLSATRVER